MAQCYCEKCGNMLDEKEFYSSNNLEKYPNGGKLNLCKKCLTMHVDNWDPDTYLSILEDLDIPYIKEEWDSLLEKYGADPTKVTGTTILGRYVSKMKLKQWNKYRWADTEKIAEDIKNKKIAAMRAAGYSGEQIEEQLSMDHGPEKPLELVS